MTIVVPGTTNGKQGTANEVPVGRGRGRKGPELSFWLHATLPENLRETSKCYGR